VPEEPVQQEFEGLRARVAELEEHQERQARAFREQAQQLRKSLQDLRGSRERFELAMQGSGDGLWDWDLLTNEVYFSPRWKSALGYEDHEVGNHFEEWESRLHPDDRERALEAIRDYFEGKKPTYQLEHRLRHKDGSYRWILARGVALRDASGKPYRMAGSHTDLTEQKQAESALRDSEALYQSLVETLPLNVYRKDLQGRIIFGNRLYFQASGLTPNELIGKTDFDLFPAHLAEAYLEDDRRVIETRETLDLIEEHPQPNGKVAYVQVLKTPVYDARGEVVGTQGILWDVTDRKLAEQEMQKAKEAAESANSAKSFFLANMSHEIRTPLNAIIGMTELVLGTDLTIEQREYLELAKKSADALLTVINDILDFSKVEAGRLELDEIDFNLRDHLGDWLNSLAPRAHQKGVELACHVSAQVPDRVKGDPTRLGQILFNLVGNAIKFTEEGEVVVDVDAASHANHEIWLHFSISDTGVGIPSEKFDFIFDPFAQADGSTTRKYGGTGLGLAIARRLVEAMGGRIWLESQPGTGSTFHFTTHLEAQAEAAKEPVIPSVGRLQGMPVLVVDDNATNRRILEETLNQWQMRPTLVGSGARALETLAQAARNSESFPLVLLDVHMPEMDGYTVAQEIRRRPELAGATVILLSSANQPGSGARNKELGIAASLTKPVKQADLLKAIVRALGMPLPEDQTGESKFPGSIPSGRRLRVLIAEDNLVNQKLAARLLEKRGHRVVVVSNGREALAAWNAQPFDVILMDVQMPEIDGLEAASAIRREEAAHGGHIPIVAMTAYAMKGDRENCLAAGMDRYISKPIRAHELFETVEKIALPDMPALPEHSAQESQQGGAFDEAAALENVGDDRDLLSELAEIFVRDCAALVGNIEAAVTQANATQLRCAAHALKGAVDNFGATATFTAAQRLESMGRDGDLNGAHEALKTLRKEIDRLLPQLQRYSRQFQAHRSKVEEVR
jgi:PAS domain S-box-containing protein